MSAWPWAWPIESTSWIADGSPLREVPRTSLRPISPRRSTWVANYWIQGGRSMAKKLYPVVATVIAALLVLSCAGGAAPTTTPGGPAATAAGTPAAQPQPAAPPTPVTAPATGPLKEILYGYGVPLTGARGATYGIPAKRTFEMAAEKIGEFVVAGQRYRFKVLFEDNPH